LRIHTHPGEILREEFVGPLGISGAALAKAVGVSAQTISQLLQEKRAISPDIAIRLAQALGTTPSFWVTLQQKHDISRAMEENAAVYSAIPRIADGA